MDSLSARRAGAQFEGLLVEQMLAPLAASFGESASFAIAPLAQSIAAHDAHGFGAVLASLLERHDV